MGTEERENGIRMVSIFKHTDEASVPDIYLLRWNIPLALGNRHHLGGGCPPFSLACENQTEPLLPAFAHPRRGNCEATSGEPV
jgi:hypothetical protein